MGIRYTIQFPLGIPRRLVEAGHVIFKEATPLRPHPVVINALTGDEVPAFVIEQEWYEGYAITVEPHWFKRLDVWTADGRIYTVHFHGVGSNLGNWEWVQEHILKPLALREAHYSPN